MIGWLMRLLGWAPPKRLSLLHMAFEGMRRLGVNILLYERHEDGVIRFSDGLLAHPALSVDHPDVAGRVVEEMLEEWGTMGVMREYEDGLASPVKFRFRKGTVLDAVVAHWPLGDNRGAVAWIHVPPDLREVE